jgi:hypothetical protein
MSPIYQFYVRLHRRVSLSSKNFRHLHRKLVLGIDLLQKSLNYPSPYVLGRGKISSFPLYKGGLRGIYSTYARGLITSKSSHPQGVGFLPTFRYKDCFAPLAGVSVAGRSTVLNLHFFDQALVEG